MKLINKLKPLVIASSCSLVCLPLVVSCSPAKETVYDKTEYMEDLFLTGYTRESQVIPLEPMQERISEANAAKRYLTSVKANKQILIDDFFWGIAYSAPITESVVTGKLGISIFDANPENKTISFEVFADKVLFQYYNFAKKSIEFYKFDGTFKAMNVPISVTWVEKWFEPFNEPEWLLSFDMDRLMFPDEDTKWSIDIKMMLTAGEGPITLDISLDGYYNYQSSYSALVELFDKISYYLEYSDIPLNFMHNVANTDITTI